MRRHERYVCINKRWETRRAMIAKMMEKFTDDSETTKEGLKGRREDFHWRVHSIEHETSTVPTYSGFRWPRSIGKSIVQLHIYTLFRSVFFPLFFFFPKPPYYLLLQQQQVFTFMLSRSVPLKRIDFVDVIIKRVQSLTRLKNKILKC